MIHCGLCTKGQDDFTLIKEPVKDVGVYFSVTYGTYAL